jgi:hypothetical protein
MIKDVIIHDKSGRADSMKTYLEVVTQTEIDQMYKALGRGAQHPLKALFLAQPTPDVTRNTERAARNVFKANQSWLSKLKPRLLDASDVTHASSALGEIRAYGGLLETAMSVKTNPRVAGKKVVPEFDVDAGDGSVIVEVHSRQLDPDQAKAIADHQKRHLAEAEVAAEEARNKGEKGVVTSSAIGVIPLGAPDRNKPGDSVLTNAISRICRIKQDDKQIDPAKPFVLWLDLQDPTVFGPVMAEEQLSPIFSEFRNEGVGTGALWFALYGRKGDAMIEMNGLDYRQTAMLHDGRFVQSPRISAVVYSLSRATVLKESPDPALRLPPLFRASLLRTPLFRLELSLCEWIPGLVKSQVNTAHNMVAAAAKALVATNPP